MTTSEITTMPGDKCILQLRGLPPFLSPKYDLKKHPNYKYTAEFDAHIGGASGQHGPKLHKLVAVQIIEIQQVSFFVRVGAVHFVHRVFVFLSGNEPVQGIVQRPFRNHHGQHGQYRIPRRPGGFHPKGYFGKLAGQGHHLYADRGPKPWTV